MKIIDWGAIFQSFQKAVDDIKANKPRPATPTMTGADIAAAAEKLQAWLPGFISAMKAHPGYITAADDVLEVLEAQGVTWASEVETGVDAAPGALQALSGWIPEILGAIEAFEPAPQPMGGGDSQHPGWGR